MVASCTPPTGDLAHNPGVCPDWELNQQPFGSQARAQSTEPHQPGLPAAPFYFTSLVLCTISSQPRSNSRCHLHHWDLGPVHAYGSCSSPGLVTLSPLWKHGHWSTERSQNVSGTCQDSELPTWAGVHGRTCARHSCVTAVPAITSLWASAVSARHSCSLVTALAAAVLSPSPSQHIPQSLYLSVLSFRFDYAGLNVNLLTSICLP